MIGISACNRQFGEETAQVVVNRYVESAMRHGHVAALIIPALPGLMEAEDIADRIDGLLLTGSPSNVEPAHYGEHDGEGPFDADRDVMSFAMISAMAKRGKPVFGICRGLQEINVAHGGTLVRDLGDAGRPVAHHADETVHLEPMFAHHHMVELTPGGVLARTFGAEHLIVNSVHYQGIGELGDGLTVEATAQDGVVEAISGARGNPVLAVQWHPEWNSDSDGFAVEFFRLVGRTLRGQPLVIEPEGEPD